MMRINTAETTLLLEILQIIEGCDTNTHDPATSPAGVSGAVVGPGSQSGTAGGATGVATAMVVLLC